MVEQKLHKNMGHKKPKSPYPDVTAIQLGEAITSTTLPVSLAYVYTLINFMILLRNKKKVSSRYVGLVQ